MTNVVEKIATKPGDYSLISKQVKTIREKCMDEHDITSNHGQLAETLHRNAAKDDLFGLLGFS